MGVSFYTCAICTQVVNENFTDGCSECRSRVCYSCSWEYKMREKPPKDQFNCYTYDDDYWFKSRLKPYWNPEEHDDLESCPLCRKEVITNDMIAEFLLKKYQLDKSQVIAEIRNEKSDV